MTAWQPRRERDVGPPGGPPRRPASLRVLLAILDDPWQVVQAQLPLGVLEVHAEVLRGSRLGLAMVRRHLAMFELNDRFLAVMI